MKITDKISCPNNWYLSYGEEWCNRKFIPFITPFQDVFIKRTSGISFWINNINIRLDPKYLNIYYNFNSDKCQLKIEYKHIHDISFDRLANLFIVNNTIAIRC